jgi:hypothetical protein
MAGDDRVERSGPKRQSHRVGPDGSDAGPLVGEHGDGPAVRRARHTGPPGRDDRLGPVGITSPLMLVADMTLLQKRTPLNLMGRVSGAAEALTTFPQILSIAMGAGLVALVDYRLLLIIMGAVLLGAGWYAWSGRQLSTPHAEGPAEAGTTGPSTEAVRQP